MTNANQNQFLIDAAGLCESEARKWASKDTKTSAHWEAVAVKLKSRWLAYGFTESDDEDVAAFDSFIEWALSRQADSPQKERVRAFAADLTAPVWTENQIDVHVQCTACSQRYVAPNPNSPCPSCGAVRRAIADNKEP